MSKDGWGGEDKHGTNLEGQKALIEWSPLWFNYAGKEAIIRKVFVDKEGFVTIGRHSYKDLLV